MKIPTLNDQGVIDTSAEMFRSAVEYTLDHWTGELGPDCEDWFFLQGASILAGEVHASGLDWEPFRDRYREAARQLGMPGEEADRLLALAWSCAPHRAARWIEMTREWVSLSDGSAIAHIASGATVPTELVGSMFGEILEDPSCELLHLFFGYLVEVSEIVHEPCSERGFRMTDDGLVLNTH